MIPQIGGDTPEIGQSVKDAYMDELEKNLAARKPSARSALRSFLFLASVVALGFVFTVTAAHLLWRVAVVVWQAT